MLSRDTKVHLAALGFAFGGLVVAHIAGVLPHSDAGTFGALILFYGIVFGGAHFYLAVKGEDGLIPVASRWRYITMLVIFIATGVAIFAIGEVTVLGIELATIGLILIAITMVSYILVESTAGYRATQTPRQ